MLSNKTCSNKRVLAPEKPPATCVGVDRGLGTSSRPPPPRNVSGLGETVMDRLLAINYAFNIMGAKKSLGQYLGKVAYTAGLAEGAWAL